MPEYRPEHARRATRLSAEPASDAEPGLVWPPPDSELDALVVVWLDEGARRAHEEADGAASPTHDWLAPGGDAASEWEKAKSPAPAAVASKPDRVDEVVAIPGARSPATARPRRTRGAIAALAAAAIVAAIAWPVVDRVRDASNEPGDDTVAPATAGLATERAERSGTAEDPGAVAGTPIATRPVGPASADQPGAAGQAADAIADRTEARGPVASVLALDRPASAAREVEPATDTKQPATPAPAALAPAAPAPAAQSVPPPIASSALGERVGGEIPIAVPQPVSPPRADPDAGALTPTPSPAAGTARTLERGSIDPGGASRPPAAPAAAPVPTEEEGVRAVLGRYRAAYEQLDAASAKAVWPSVDERALARAFEGLRSQGVVFDACQFAFSGNTATATCDGRATYVARVGSSEPRTQPRRWTFRLRRSGEGWIIADARVR